MNCSELMTNWTLILITFSDNDFKSWFIIKTKDVFVLLFICFKVKFMTNSAIVLCSTFVSDIAPQQIYRWLTTIGLTFGWSVKIVTIFTECFPDPEHDRGNFSYLNLINYFWAPNYIESIVRAFLNYNWRGDLLNLATILHRISKW